MNNVTSEVCNGGCAKYCADMLAAYEIPSMCAMIGWGAPCNNCGSNWFDQDFCISSMESGAWTWTWSCDYDPWGNPPNWNTDLYCQNVHPHTDCGSNMYWGWDDISQTCICKHYISPQTNWTLVGSVLYDNIGVNSGGQCHRYIGYEDYYPEDECHNYSMSCTDKCSVDYQSATQDMWDPASCCMMQYNTCTDAMENCWMLDESYWKIERVVDHQNICTGIPNPSSEKYWCYVNMPNNQVHSDKYQKAWR
jgi:hypothetical protein